MKLTTTMAAVASVFVCAQSAQAHSYHHRYAGHHEARRHGFTRHYAAAHREQWTNGTFGYAAQASDSGWRWQQPSARPARANARSRADWQQTAYVSPAADHSGLGGRPSAWCGWEMRQLVGGDPGPSYNLAHNWAHWGHSGPAGVGAVVVWAHHVGKIVGQQNGQWLVMSGNDGNRVRTRPLPIGNAIAIRWG
jgi:hypothetical protein